MTSDSSKEWASLKYELRLNRGYPKAQLILSMFRAGRALRRTGTVGTVLAIALRVVYRALVEWIFAVELPWGVVAGPGIKLEHPTGIVTHPKVRLGRDVTIKQHVTLGIRGEGPESSGAPMIGDNVIIGSAAQILGGVTVGDSARIGAGAIVLRDVPAGHTAVGVPARLISP
jgi:serine acetyltransferase